MAERLPELGQLFLTETFRVSDEDLVLSLIEGPLDGGDHLSPASTKGIHGVFTVGVVKDQGCLHSLRLREIMYKPS